MARAMWSGPALVGWLRLTSRSNGPSSSTGWCCLVTSPGGDHASYALPELVGLDPDDSFPIRMRLFDERWDPAAAEPIPGLGVVYGVVVEQHHAVPPPDVQAGLTRQLAARDGHDVVDALSTIGHETLVAAGRYDMLAPMANSELLRDRMPNARLAVFEGGHFVSLQDRAVWPTIVDFLQERA